MKLKRTMAALAAAAVCLSSLALMPSADDAPTLRKRGESPTTAVTELSESAADETEITFGAGADEQFSPYVKYTVTEEDLAAAGVEWKGSSKATVYVKMTEGGADSKINAMIKLGPDGDNGQPVGKASSKYLSGRNVASGNAIQDNLVGAAGTGCYKFPDVNLNKSMQDGSSWDSSYEDEITLTVRIDTENTDCEFLGVKFSNGAVYPSDFTPPKTEAATYDVIATDSRELLGMTLDYCGGMDASKYLADSWDALQEELEKAREVYDKAGVTDEECKTARASLEKVKANMLFEYTGTEENPLPWRNLTNDEIVNEMGAGINLGNTMDGHSGFTPNETCWQSAETTKAYIKALHDAGFNTVRIPVTWGNMIDTENGYSINDSWISRVQDIVDYCVSQDMYAIINIHHDGAEQSGWLRVAADDIDAVYEEFECVWRNIAEYFKDYDEHLIFESMNEITCMEGDSKNSAEAIAYDTPIIVNLNQIFVNTVRSTGSNNSRRWLAAVSHYANGGTQSGFTLPTDAYNEENRIMFAAHIYKASTNVTWTYNEVYQVVDGLKKMAAKHDVPLILGEYGTRTYAQSGTATGYNDEARAYFSEIVHRACRTAGCVPVVWDQGYGSNGEYETGLFSYWNRNECRPIFKSIIDAMMRGTYLPNSERNNSYDYKDVVQSPQITPITEIDLGGDSVIMTLGDVYTVSAQTSPADSNDVLLWSVDDDTVATVSQGRIRAKSVGVTTVRAYSQNGDAEAEITVRVTPLAGVEAEAINCDSVYNVITGKYAYIGASVEPSSASDIISYKSSNTNIATVNALGKVVGVNSGVAYVTMTTASGLTKTVKIVVSDVEITGEMDLALHVLYNDSQKQYWGCETGTPVTVNGDGTYTVSFDLSKDLSAAGKNAGITEINKLTAIYIKDIDVTEGSSKRSPIDSAEIRYDSVKVNGTELTLNTNAFASAMNGTVFDSGKPVNAWDGSVVEEVTASDHTASFTTVSKPTTVEVTFTLKNVKFSEASSGNKNEATGIEAVTAEKVVLENVGDTAELTVSVSPADSDSLVSFVTADSSVAAVDCTALRPDPETGLATVTVTAMKEGKTTVTAMTENGLEVVFEIIVGEDDTSSETPDSSDASSESVPDSSVPDSSDTGSSVPDTNTSGENSSNSGQSSSANGSSSSGAASSGTSSASASAASSVSSSKADETKNPATGKAGAVAAAGIVTAAAFWVVSKKNR